MNDQDVVKSDTNHISSSLKSCNVEVCMCLRTNTYMYLYYSISYRFVEL